MTIVGLAITVGMNSGLTTKISQTFGTKNMKLCGVYYNQARIVITLAFIPLLVILSSSYYIFRAFNFEEEVSEYAQLFVWYKLPYLYFYSLFDATKRLLQNVGFQKVPMNI